MCSSAILSTTVLPMWMTRLTGARRTTTRTGWPVHAGRWRSRRDESFFRRRHQVGLDSGSRNAANDSWRLGRARAGGAPPRRNIPTVGGPRGPGFLVYDRDAVPSELRGGVFRPEQPEPAIRARDDRDLDALSGSPAVEGRRALRQPGALGRQRPQPYIRNR